MSTTPAVRKPYCAGSAPVTSETWLANRACKVLAKPASPSGNCTPLMRYCTLRWSPRMNTLPNASCTTPGARSSTWFSPALSPWGIASMAWRLKSVRVAPRLG